MYLYSTKSIEFINLDLAYKIMFIISLNININRHRNILYKHQAGIFLIIRRKTTNTGKLKYLRNTSL